jgi:hypothetical protein
MPLSQGQLAHEGGLELARKLGIEATVFSGDHGGFDGRPEEFAAKLGKVLSTCVNEEHRRRAARCDVLGRQGAAAYRWMRA